MSERAVAEGRIAWARRRMPVLGDALAELARLRVFDGLTIGFRLHLEPKTAVLIEGLLVGGARVVAMGNEGTTRVWYCRGAGRPGLYGARPSCDGKIRGCANL
ncbi:MAG: hypothetical protein OXM88_14975 [bacterium]|nr:hypothetical protein [bacterium]